MASSKSRLLSFWTGPPISSRRRGSTGIATTGCLRRITSSGPPSRHWQSATSASNGRSRTAGMGTTVAPQEAAATRLTRIKRPARTTPHGKAWAKLMARVGEEFPFACPNCGGDIRLIAFLTEPGPIRKILTHLGAPLEPPPIAPARGPPAAWGELVQVHFRPGNLSRVARRPSRDRHPQHLTAAGRQVATSQPGRRTRRASAQTLEKGHSGGGSHAGRERPGAGRETGARGSRAAHQLGNRCRRAIGRAILRRGSSAATGLATNSRHAAT